MRPSKNVAQKMIESPTEQAEAVQAFADVRGETFRAVVLHALRRRDVPDAVVDPPVRANGGDPQRLLEEGAGQ
jgi:hypothetical protein